MFGKKKREKREEILNAIEGRKIIKIKNSFKARWELFVIGWKHTRKFPDYSLMKEIKKLIIQPKVKVVLSIGSTLVISKIGIIGGGV